MNSEIAADLQSLMAFELVRLGRTELTVGGLVAASFVVRCALTDADIDRTVEVVDAASQVYARALSEGVSGYLVGRPVKPTLRRYV